jgi:hypothetical protein
MAEPEDRELPVVVPIEDWIDLHAFTPVDVPSVVATPERGGYGATVVRLRPRGEDQAE